MSNTKMSAAPARSPGHFQCLTGGSSRKGVTAIPKTRTPRIKRFYFYTGMSLDKDRKFITGFLELYKQHDCLWRVKSRDYSNKVKRTCAYQEMVEFSRPFVEYVNISWVKCKIQNLRTVFKKEVNKVEQSKRYGAGTDDIYQSPLWYYDLLTFTLDQEPVCKPLALEAKCEDKEWVEELALSPEKGPRTPNPPIDTQRPPSPTALPRKRTRKERTMARKKEAQALISKPLDASDIFGNYAAQKHREVSPGQRPHLEKLFQDLVYGALNSRLSFDTSILFYPPAMLPLLPSVCH